MRSHVIKICISYVFYPTYYLLYLISSTSCLSSSISCFHLVSSIMSFISSIIICFSGSSVDVLSSIFYPHLRSSYIFLAWLFSISYPLSPHTFDIVSSILYGYPCMFFFYLLSSIFSVPIVSPIFYLLGSIFFLLSTLYLLCSVFHLLSSLISLLVSVFFDISPILCVLISYIMSSTFYLLPPPSIFYFTSCIFYRFSAFYLPAYTLQRLSAIFYPISFVFVCFLSSFFYLLPSIAYQPTSPAQPNSVSQPMLLHIF